MDRSITHPLMLSGISHFFRQRCDIQHYTAEAVDSYGQPNPVWSNLADHQNLPCAIYPTTARELKGPDRELVIASHGIKLAGRFTSITPKMRAVVNSQTYDVLAVGIDSQNVTTDLQVQVVT